MDVAFNLQNKPVNDHVLIKQIMSDHADYNLLLKLLEVSITLQENLELNSHSLKLRAFNPVYRIYCEKCQNASYDKLNY